MQPFDEKKVISVNVGVPREVEWKGELVSTAIFKEPIEGRIELKQLNLAGDRQADLSVHGGPDKAVYVYPVEYYDFWKKELPEVKFHGGMFGENLTVSGFLDDTIHIGDCLSIGTTRLIVTQPRFPCYKLSVRFNDAGMTKHFLKGGYFGFYLRVLQEGTIGAGDEISVLSQEANRVKVSDIIRLYLTDKNDLEGLQRALQVEALEDGWKELFRERLAKLQ